MRLTSHLGLNLDTSRPATLLLDIHNVDVFWRHPGSAGHSGFVILLLGLVEIGLGDRHRNFERDKVL